MSAITSQLSFDRIHFLDIHRLLLHVVLVSLRPIFIRQHSVPFYCYENYPMSKRCIRHVLLFIIFMDKFMYYYIVMNKTQLKFFILWLLIVQLHHSTIIHVFLIFGISILIPFSTIH